MCFANVTLSNITLAGVTSPIIIQNKKELLMIALTLIAFRTSFNFVDIHNECASREQCFLKNVYIICNHAYYYSCCIVVVIVLGSNWLKQQIVSQLNVNAYDYSLCQSRYTHSFIPFTSVFVFLELERKAKIRHHSPNSNTVVICCSVDLQQFLQFCTVSHFFTLKVFLRLNPRYVWPLVDTGFKLLTENMQCPCSSKLLENHLLSLALEHFLWKKKKMVTPLKKNPNPSAVQKCEGFPDPSHFPCTNIK